MATLHVLSANYWAGPAFIGPDHYMASSLFGSRQYTFDTKSSSQYHVLQLIPVNIGGVTETGVSGKKGTAYTDVCIINALKC